MPELLARFQREYRRFKGELEDVIEGRTIAGHSIKGPVKVKGLLPKDRHVYLLGDWVNVKGAKQFKFHSWVEERDILGVRRIQSLLRGRGFSKKIPARAITLYSPQRIETNPFLLMQYPSASFDRCDKLWLDLGRPPASRKRIVYMIVNLMDNSRGGHVWFARDAIVAEVMQHVGSEARVHSAIEMATRAVMIESRTVGGGFDGEVFLASQSLAEDERFVSEWIRRKMIQHGWPANITDGLDEDQLEAVQLATRASVGVLLGGGGTGKTYTVAQMIAAIGDVRKCRLAAPTGKAAVRLSQSVVDGFQGTRMEGQVIRATTLHKLIGSARWQSSRTDRDEQDEHFTREKPKPARYYFVDETSMLDIRLFAEFVSILPADACVLFVGDSGQLPPVGPGAPLRDISTIPSCGTITKTRRNGGMILEAGKEIREGKPFLVADKHEGDQNLVHVHATEDEAAKEVVRLFQMIADQEFAGNLIEASRDVQILGVMNTHGSVSVANLNKAIRKVVHESIGELPFQLNDKVINTENNHYIPKDKYNIDDEAIVDRGGCVYVANGEQGIVTEVSNGAVTIHLEYPTRQVRIWQERIHTKSQAGVTGSPWKHGFVITTHKSQGSQWPYVICVLDPAARHMWDRALLYTMITRAVKCCYLVGDYEVARRALLELKISKRRTFLKELINGDFV